MIRFTWCFFSSTRETHLFALKRHLCQGRVFREVPTRSDLGASGASGAAAGGSASGADAGGRAVGGLRASVRWMGAQMGDAWREGWKDGPKWVDGIKMTCRIQEKSCAPQMWAR